MLKEIKNYNDNNILISHYFFNENLLLQGFYKTFHDNGIIKYKTFEIDSESYGIVKSFSEDGIIIYIETKKIKQGTRNGVDIIFNNRNTDFDFHF